MKFLFVFAALLVAANAQFRINEAECGTARLVSTNVVGGTTTKHGDHPHIISMEYRSSAAGTFSHSCGGSVINKGWILTAAHCVSGRSAANLRIQIGSYLRNTNDAGQISRFVSQIFMHPAYSSSTFKNDIALLKLSEPITAYTDKIRPVCIPQATNTIGSGSVAVAAGWGTLSSGASSLPNDLRQVTLPVTTSAQVAAQYGSAYDSVTMIPFGIEGDGKDTCQGDSGGPVVMPDKISGKTTLYGATSWGYGCGGIGIYTRVSNYYNWINQILAANP